MTALCAEPSAFTAVRAAPATFLEMLACPRSALPRTGPHPGLPALEGASSSWLHPPRGFTQSRQVRQEPHPGRGSGLPHCGAPHTSSAPQGLSWATGGRAPPDPGHLQEASTSFSPRGTKGGTQKITG